MCGIAGYSGKGNNAVLKAMNDTLTHRGPDDKGERVFEGLQSNGTLGLAQRRLSIIDPTPTGHQPMTNEREDVWIVFNGEIYNFEKLKSELKEKHTFRGASDTEVIVHLYEEVGEDVFSLIDGMFAIALYDKKKEKLFLARDKMGKKPLYWSMQDKTLLFASELKALMAHPDFVRDIDPASVEKYFQYSYIPTPHSIFKNTWKLEPGTYLSWDGKTSQKTQFWKPTFTPKKTSFKASLIELDTELERAVKDRLVSDVPLGVFLSGGIDSSTIAYYAQKLQKDNEKIKTFSIGFEEDSFDESSYAKEVAEKLGTDHFEHILSVEECMKLIGEMGEHLDEPMADSSMMPTYLLSRFTRSHVTVALSGDGGDELFSGYDTFLAHRFARYYSYVPKSFRKAFAWSVQFLPTSHKNISLDFKLKKSTQNFEGDPKYLDQRWMGIFNEQDRAKLFNQETKKALKGTHVFEDVDQYHKQVDTDNTFDILTLLYERMYMMDKVLVKVDRASMAHALEVRSPLLDTAVVTLANHLPTKFKFKGLTRKYILKKLMEGKLPKEIIYRKKKGFGMPIGAWMKDELKEFMQEQLSKEALEEIGFFNTEYVADLIREHIEGKRDNREQLWTLLVFVLWWKRWMKEN